MGPGKPYLKKSEGLTIGVSSETDVVGGDNELGLMVVGFATIVSFALLQNIDLAKAEYIGKVTGGID